MISNVFIVPNGTLIAEIVAFVIVLVVVAKYILPPLNRALEERQGAIRDELAAADAARAEAQAADVERREALDGARARAREIVDQATHTAERLALETRERAQREYDRIVADAEQDIRLARQRALEDAAQRLGELVVDVVERVVGREMDADAHRDLIDEAVGTLTSNASGTSS